MSKVYFVEGFKVIISLGNVLSVRNLKTGELALPFSAEWTAAVEATYALRGL